MALSQQRLHQLHRLLSHGDFHQLLDAVTTLWPSDRPDGLGALADFLLHTRTARRDVCQDLYDQMAPVLTCSRHDLEAVAQLGRRHAAVLAFEGRDAGEAFLRRQAAELPADDRGFPLMLLGRHLTDEGRIDEARDLLREAIRAAEMSVEWYLLSVIREMARCQLHAGETALSFEYVRAYWVKSYVRGKISGPALKTFLLGSAAAFGQIDYLVELQLNVATCGRREELPAPSEHADLMAALLSELGIDPPEVQEADGLLEAVHAEHFAALHLADLGKTDEALEAFGRAADDATRLETRLGAALYWMSRLLAVWLRPREEEAVALLAEFGDWSPATAARGLLHGCLPYAVDTTAWRRVLAGGPIDGDSAAHDEHQALVTAVAVLGRLAEAAGATEQARALYQVVLDCGSQELWLGSLVLRRLIALLVGSGSDDDLERAGAIGAARLEKELRPMARWHLLTELAHGRAAQGRPAAALALVEQAITLWKRVLSGLYDPRSKVAWLERGARSLDLAVDLLSVSGDWIDESDRLDKLLTVTELSKARLMTDAINRKEYLPGPFMLTERYGLNADRMEQAREEAPDWHAAVALQSVVYSESLVYVDWGHDWRHENSRPAREVATDLGPLRTTLRIPLSHDRELLASVDTVTYDVSGLPADTELIDLLSSADG
ncbi:hypothetical protein ACSNOJ_11340 [Streptomyces sp. URMC 128]|uniref:hypothetical protein n=1 Tax=Streptomyces sp. URMC 128 TaxID=3423404 RepID=UPI003F1D404A